MNPKFKGQLHHLFELYRQRLPAKVEAIDDLWKAEIKKKEGWDFTTVHREMHSLCGASGTYGYHQLSQVARECEQRLKTLLNIQHLHYSEKKKINDLMEDIKQLAINESPIESPIVITSSSECVNNKQIDVLSDDEDFLKRIKETIISEHYQLNCFSHVKDLMLSIEQQAPIVVILDTELLTPEVISSFLKLQKNQKTPLYVICLVPNAELMPRLVAIRAGCDAFIQKPVDMAELTQLINDKYNLGNIDAYRILVVEDSASLAEYYSLILKEAGMDARPLTNPLLLLSEMQSFQPNLLLMDIYMPSCTGLELATVLRQEAEYTKIPIIFLSSETDRAKKMDAIDLGGDDFLTKPVSPAHLISAVRARLKRARILNRYMTIDSLTGLSNHSTILIYLEKEIEKAKRNHKYLSFVMLDIDQFKRINDTYGHPVGDLVLKKLGLFLQMHVGSQSNAGRYGGEEFAIVMPGFTREQAQQHCEKMLHDFSKISFKVKEDTFFVTFSAGVAGVEPGNYDKDLVLEADLALYQAKRRGRNQVLIFEKAFEEG